MTGFDPAELRRLTVACTSAMHGSATQHAHLVTLGRYTADHFDAIVAVVTERDEAQAASRRMTLACNDLARDLNEARAALERIEALHEQADAEEMDGGDLWMALGTILQGDTVGSGAQPARPQCRHRHPTRGIQCELEPDHGGECAIGALPQSRWYPS